MERVVTVRRILRVGALALSSVALGTCKIDELVNPQPPGELTVSLSAVEDSAAVGSQPVRRVAIALGSTGGGALGWSAARTAGSAWLALNPARGTTPDSLRVLMTPAGLAAGTYRDTVVVTQTNSGIDPIRIPVRFDLHPCRAQPVTPGAAPLADSLTASDCGAPHQSGRFGRLFAFSGAVGDSVSVMLRSTAFAPLVVLDTVVAAGTPVAEASACPGDAAAACLTYVWIRRSGTYYVEATSQEAGRTGPFTLAIANPRAPGAPGSLAQFLPDTATPIAVGGSAATSSFVVRAQVSDPDAADSLSLQIELRPVGTPFTGVPTATGSLRGGSGPAAVSHGGLTDNTAYHWQARVRDHTGRAGPWVAFGGNAETAPDLQITVAQAPAVPTTLEQRAGTVPVAVGGVLAQSDVTFRGVVHDPDPGDRLRLEVEVRPLNTAFTNTANGSSAGVPTDNTASVVITDLVDDRAYHWQARTVDLGGLASAWVSFGGNAENAADFSIAIPQDPAPPTDLAQFAANGVTPLSLGDSARATTVVLRATVTDPDPLASLRLQVEVRPVGSAFTGVPTHSGTPVASATVASVAAGPLPDDTNYHWQARVQDEVGLVSGWVAFGGNAETATDFRVHLPAVRLAFLVQPSNAVVNAILTPPVQVEARKETGARDAAFARDVVVSLDPESGTEGAALAGSDTVRAAAGVATFSDLSVDAVGTGYRMLAATLGLASATSAPFAITTVPAAATSTAVTSSLNPSTFGQSLAFTATVTSGAGTPTGSVQFQIDGGDFGPPVTLAGGAATSPAISTLSAGIHVVTASYLGTPEFQQSTGTLAGGQQVNQAATTTAVSSPGNPSTFGQAVTFTATVSSESSVPTGSVQFAVDGLDLGAPAPLVGGVATSDAISTLPAGTHEVAAAYLGSTNHVASADTLAGGHVVNQASTATTVSSPVNPSTFGQAVTFTAVVTSGAGVPTGSVQFRIDNVAFGTPVAMAGGTATSGAISTLTVGTHQVTAHYLDGGNFAASADTLTGGQVVNRAPTTTTVSSSVNPSTPAQAVTFTAVVTSGAGVPTGSVQFRIDDVAFGAPVALVDGTATSGATSALTVGTHQVTGDYSGDVNFAVSADTLSQVVALVPTTTTLSSSVNPSTFGQEVTFAATVASEAGAPTGTVQFRVDGVDFGTPVALVDGTATSGATSALTVGTHQVTGDYSGDVNFAVSADTLSQAVGLVPTTTTVSSSVNPSTFGEAVTFTATVTSEAGEPGGSVQFRIDNVAFGTPVALAGGQATSGATTALSVGTHVVVAEYLGATGFAASIDTLDGGQVVGVAPTTTTVTSSVNPSVSGQLVTFTATVTSGGGVPTGNVRFRIDGMARPPVALAGGVAATTTSTLTVGTHVVTAEYLGAANFAASLDTLDGGQVVSPVPTQVGLTTQPSRTVVNGVVFPQQPALQLRDGDGSAVLQSGVEVTAEIATGGGALGGTLTATTDGSGVAGFTNLSITGTAGDRTLRFTTPGLDGDTSATVTVTAGTATALVVAGIADPATAGSAATVTVTAQDGSGSVATGYTGTVSFTSSDPQAVLPGPYTFTGTDAGAHQFSVTLLTAGDQTITASDGTLTGSQTAITVQPAAPASMTIQAGNDAAAVVGSSVATPPAVRVTDAFGNPVAGVAVDFTVTAGGGGVTDPAPVTNGEGIATVTAWTLGSTTAMSDTGTFANALEATSPAGTVTFTARARYSYATHVQPIWNANCTGCHGAIAPALTAGVSWGNLVDQDAVCDATFKRVALNGTSTAEAISVLMAKLEGTTLGTCAGVMPPVTGPLPPATRDVVRAWIRNGALNN